MFIYGAGLAAAKTAGTRLRVDIGQHAARPDRPFLLERLGLPAEYVDVGWQPEPSRAGRLMGGTPKVPRGCTFRESGFRYDEQVLGQPVGGCLFGYFQSWRYLAPVATELRARLRGLERERSGLLEEPAAMLADPRAVALHVRRGDYMHHDARGYHGVAGLRFYRDALDTLHRMGFDGPVYLFSDDVPAALSELSGLAGLRPLTEQPLEALDELLLMSGAPALVTANSSFSWWAGWLGDRADRPVISPRPWFDDPAVDARDLLPTHWLTLDRREL